MGAVITLLDSRRLAPSLSFVSSPPILHYA